MRSGRPRAAPEATRRRAEQVANAFVEFEATVLQGTIHRRICALATGAPLACVEACVYTRAASSAFPRALPLRQPSQYTMGYGLWAMLASSAKPHTHAPAPSLWPMAEAYAPAIAFGLSMRHLYALAPVVERHLAARSTFSASAYERSQAASPLLALSLSLSGRNSLTFEDRGRAGGGGGGRAGVRSRALLRALTALISWISWRR